MSYWRDKRFFRKSQPLHPVSLPSRPRQYMGENIKFQHVFLTNFDDGFEHLTPASGVIDPKGCEHGYLLFVSFTFGDWNPKIDKGYVKIEISFSLTTGEKLKAKGSIKTSEDWDYFESWVPGIKEHLQQECTLNAFIEK